MGGDGRGDVVIAFLLATSGPRRLLGRLVEN
jgi:hypothetical protein